MNENAKEAMRKTVKNPYILDVFELEWNAASGGNSRLRPVILYVDVNEMDGESFRFSDWFSGGEGEKNEGGEEGNGEDFLGEREDAENEAEEH